MARIKGKVVDYVSDLPILGVSILALAKDGSVFAEATTNEQGVFDMEHQGFDDPYAKLEFDKEGYATQTMRAVSANGVDVPLPKAGTLGEVTLTVKRNKTKVALILIAGVILGYFFMKYKGKIKW